jgi:hypothetical protein
MAAHVGYPGYVVARPLNYKSPRYIPGEWKPEPELAAPAPRTLAGWSLLMACLPMALVVVVALYFFLKPLLRCAYILEHGRIAGAIVIAKYQRTTNTLHGPIVHDFMAVRFETPAGWVTGRIGVTPGFYGETAERQWVTVRYLLSSPPRFALEGEPWYQFPLVWGLFAMAFGLIGASCIYTRMSNLLRRGIPLPGSVMSVCEDAGLLRLQVYFERDGVPYSLEAACKMRAYRSYRIGGWITILVDPRARTAPERCQKVLVYPLSKLHLRRA